MTQLTDHPLRYLLANELHARPFPNLDAPGFAVYVAIKPEKNAASRDRAADRNHLIQLLDRFGAAHPQPDATHYFGALGKHHLKWESHTEFVTYTILGAGVSAKPFDAREFDVFPSDWLAAAPGLRITSVLIRVEPLVDENAAARKLEKWFIPESVASSTVLDGAAIIGGDFRIDAGGHMRMAIFAKPETGERRIGRIIQRLCEIETYKAMSMFGLSRARTISKQLGPIDAKLTSLVAAMRGDVTRSDATLDELLTISAELEDLSAQSSFRLSATGAYSRIVNDRISVLREERFEGRQTFGEFMMRRFDPAMRTVEAAERQLRSMSDRAIRAAELLRTRVDVERSAQNQELLASMDRRADLQLRLQKTVEGLSVVAISYYAVNLAAYMAYPLTEPLGMSKGLATAILTPLVILLVWLLVRQIRKSMEH